MSSWLAGAADEVALIERLPVLAPKLLAMRGEAAAACPGRTGELVLARAGQLIAGTGDLDAFGELDAGEQVVVALTEQFLIDVHGIDDALFARLSQHYTPSEQIAIMFQLAFADGFTKFRRTFGVD